MADNDKPRMNPSLVRTFIGPRGPWVNDAKQQSFGNPDASGDDTPWIPFPRGD